MGMVNYAWDDFMEWVDAGVEIVSPHEKEARTSLSRDKES
jgi:hypothetical protein